MVRSGGHLMSLNWLNAPRRRQVAFYADLEVSPIRPTARNWHRAPGHKRAPSVDAQPDVSVVLGSYNRLVLLKRAIESVRENLSSIRGEIVVVDGGSSDGSVEWLVGQHDIVSIVQHNRYVADGIPRRRMSWGRFMNIGFRAAGADHIAMISDDCCLLPNALANAVARIDSAKSAGIRVGACAFYFRNWPAESAYYVQRTIGGNLMVNHGIFRRDALEAVGYANEDDYAFYKADSDLSLSIWRAGYAIIDAPGAICEHFVSQQEAARISNNAVMDFDREQLHRRWPDLVTREGRLKMGKKTLAFNDPSRTAERAFSDQINVADEPLPSAGVSPAS